MVLPLAQASYITAAALVTLRFGQFRTAYASGCIQHVLQFFAPSLSVLPVKLAAVQDGHQSGVYAYLFLIFFKSIILSGVRIK